MMDVSPNGDTMADVVRLTTEQLVEQLAALEREFGMPAQQFYERYRAGEFGDAPGVMHWAGICYMAVRAGVLRPRTLSA
jgi:hypothetical protein